MAKSAREARQELYNLEDSLEEDEKTEESKAPPKVDSAPEVRRRPGETEEWQSDINPKLHFTFIMPRGVDFSALAPNREIKLGAAPTVKPSDVEPLMRRYVKPDPYDKPHGVEMTPLEWEELVMAFWSFCYS